jgi:hypothetical protein
MTQLLRTFNWIQKLRIWPYRFQKKYEFEYLDLVIGLSKWLQRGLEKPENSILTEFEN